MILTTNLKLLCDGVDFTTLLVEKVRISPQQLCLLFKSSPGLKVADTCATTSAMHALNRPLQFSQRHGITDDFVVFLQRARR